MSGWRFCELRPNGVARKGSEPLPGFLLVSEQEHLERILFVFKRALLRDVCSVESRIKVDEVPQIVQRRVLVVLLKVAVARPDVLLLRAARVVARRTRRFSQHRPRR